MKKINTIETLRGVQYKIYMEIPNERCERFYIKWQNSFLGIKYFTFIKTEYVICDNEPIRFSDIDKALAYIETLETFYIKTAEFQNKINFKPAP